MLTPETVREELKRVYDPEVMLNIVDMGLVYGIDVAQNNDIQVRMTLTTPHCPMGPQIIDDVERTAGGMEGAGKVGVDIVWEPRWSPMMFSEDLKAELREMGVEFEPSMIPDHTPKPEPAPVPPARKRGRLFGWLFGR